MKLKEQEQYEESKNYETFCMFHAAHIIQKTGHLPTIIPIKGRTDFAFQFPATIEVITAAADYSSANNEFHKFAVIYKNLRSTIIRKRIDREAGKSGSGKQGGIV